MDNERHALESKDSKNNAGFISECNMEFCKYKTEDNLCGKWINDKCVFELLIKLDSMAAMGYNTLSFIAGAIKLGHLSSGNISQEKLLSCIEDKLATLENSMQEYYDLIKLDTNKRGLKDES